MAGQVSCNSFDATNPTTLLPERCAAGRTTPLNFAFSTGFCTSNISTCHLPRPLCCCCAVKTQACNMAQKVRCFVAHRWEIHTLRTVEDAGLYLIAAPRPRKPSGVQTRPGGQIRLFEIIAAFTCHASTPRPLLCHETRAILRRYTHDLHSRLPPTTFGGQASRDPQL